MLIQLQLLLHEVSQMVGVPYVACSRSGTRRIPYFNKSNENMVQLLLMYNFQQLLEMEMQVSRAGQQSSQAVLSSSQAQSTASVEIVHQRQINKAHQQVPLVPSHGKLITEDFCKRFSIQLPQSVSEEDVKFMSLVATDIITNQTDKRLIVRLGGIHYVI
ncbi:hypothetical protein MP228_002841 [Amoeboaphelidium protococcarum]|nr:hypothetical protein MP228_002841 [Amoeboaphelidium protococcarum]